MTWSFIPPHAPYSAAFNPMLVLFCLFRFAGPLHISTRPTELLHVGPTALEDPSTHLRSFHSKLIFSMWSLRSKDHNSEFVGKVEEALVLGSWGITPGKVVAFLFFSRAMDCWSLGHWDAMSTLPFARGEKWTRIWKDGWRTLGVTHMSKVFELGKWEGQHGINYDNPWHNNKSYFRACPPGDCHVEAFQTHKAQLVTTRILKYCEPHRRAFGICTFMGD